MEKTWFQTFPEDQVDFGGSPARRDVTNKERKGRLGAARERLSLPLWDVA